MFHAGFACVVTLLGAALWGYSGLGVALGFTAFFWLWEALTPIAVWHGCHPWGDVIDYLAFQAGQILAAVICLAGGVR